VVCRYVHTIPLESLQCGRYDVQYILNEHMPILVCTYILPTFVVTLEFCAVHIFYGMFIYWVVYPRCFHTFVVLCLA
jgi:hypothetical protein